LQPHFSKQFSRPESETYSLRSPDFSLAIATVCWFPAVLLAFGYLYFIGRHYSGKVNVSKDNQGLY
jgi:hypothetical protein